MLYVKIVTLLFGAVLKWIGGSFWHNAQRFILPCVLAISAGIITHSLWCLTMLSSIGIISLGYGDKSAFRHIFGDGWGRGIWGLLVALSLSLGLVASNHFYLFWFLPYLAVNFTLENVLKKVNQFIGDPIIGASLASVIFLIH